MKYRFIMEKKYSLFYGDNMSFLINFIVMLTAFSYVLNGHTKKEHSNLVVFKNKSIVKVHCVTFTVTDAHVTPSQPSHIELGKQLTHHHSDPMILIVKAGRKKSKSVARYFNDQVGKNNSEGTYATELNFAVRGTLALFQDHACIYKIVEFKDIFMAQEHIPPFVNNWWIGGKNCFYEHDRAFCRADYNITKLFWSFGTTKYNNTIDIIAKRKQD